jgi:low affinity Fe/Cu permease
VASQSWFNVVAKWASRSSGKPVTFLLALLLILAWGVTGPLFGFNDTWQLVINTTTTIITFLMVFLIQHTQNRDTAAIQIKLDELIRAAEGAHNVLLDLEELDEPLLEKLRARYVALASKARSELAQGGLDTDRPTMEMERADQG